MNLDLLLILTAVIMLIVGLAVGTLLQKKAHEREIDGANKTAKGIIELAEKEAATRKKKFFWKQRTKIINIALKLKMN